MGLLKSQHGSMIHGADFSSFSKNYWTKISDETPILVHFPEI